MSAVMESDKSENINHVPRIKVDEVRKRKGAVNANATRYFREYCGNTSIHGFKYLSEKRTLVERLWWIFSISLSLSVCVVVVMKTYEKWENSPVIVSFATKETPAWQMPFPAVTICPETKSIPSKFNYTEVLLKKIANESLTDDDEKKLGYLSLVCEYKNDVTFDTNQKFANADIFDFLDEVKPDFSSVATDCWVFNAQYNCSDIFFPIITDDGVCYTFNLLDRTQIFRDNVVHYKHYHKAPELSNWTLEQGYHPEDGIETYPRRALFSGADYAMALRMEAYEDELDYFCGDSVQGFKLEISHPSRIPTTYDHHFKLPLNQAVLASVEPVIMQTSAAVKKYDARKRNCYFPSERPLKYFQIYTQENCQIECKTNFTIEKCGCVDVYMPKDSKTKVCSAASLDCMYEAELDMLVTEIERYVAIMQEESETFGCDCLPVCTSMRYNIEISQSDWNWRRQFPSNNKDKYMSYIKIFFKAAQFITSERNELYGPTDFLASFGGLLGLFTGFSVLSFIEIVYYLSLRLLSNFKLYRNWYGS